MSKFKLFVGGTLLLVALSLGLVKVAGAHSFYTGSDVSVGQNKPIDNTVFLAGRSIDLNGDVNGDVFCAGQTVNITGTIHGDIICAGQTINVNGTVDGNVRLAGQTVNLTAKVRGNATVAGQSFNLGSTAEIGGDLTVGGTDSTVSGKVGRDIAAGGNSLAVSGQVGRNIKASVNRLELLSAARVAGNVDVTSKNDVIRRTGAVVGGQVSRTEPTNHAASKHWAVFGLGIMWFAYWFLAMLFTAMIITLIFPHQLQAISEHGIKAPWKSILYGFLANIALPVVLFALAITVIGVPLALITGLSWLVVMILSGPVAGYYLGRQILQKSKKPLAIMAVGASALLVLYFIPFIGFVALLAAIWGGTGMILQEIFHKSPKPAYDLATSRKK